MTAEHDLGRELRALPDGDSFGLLDSAPWGTIACSWARSSGTSPPLPVRMRQSGSVPTDPTDHATLADHTRSPSYLQRTRAAWGPSTQLEAHLHTAVRAAGSPAAMPGRPSAESNCTLTAEPYCDLNTAPRCSGTSLIAGSHTSRPWLRITARGKARSRSRATSDLEPTAIRSMSSLRRPSTKCVRAKAVPPMNTTRSAKCALRYPSRCEIR